MHTYIYVYAGIGSGLHVLEIPRDLPASSKRFRRRMEEFDPGPSDIPTSQRDRLLRKFLYNIDAVDQETGDNVLLRL